MHDSQLSEPVSMNTEVIDKHSGTEEMNFHEYYLRTTGQRLPFLPTMPSLTFLSLSGSTTSIPVSSSTHYQWDALYEAWKLGTHLQSWLKTLASLPRERQYIQRMDSNDFVTSISNESWQNIANTTYTFVSKFSEGWCTATLLRNSDSST